MAGDIFTRLCVTDPLNSNCAYLDIVPSDWQANNSMIFSLTTRDGSLSTLRNVETQMSPAAYNNWNYTDQVLCTWAVGVMGVVWDGLIHTDGFQTGVNDGYNDGYF